jgi:DNA primase catalytic core
MNDISSFLDDRVFPQIWDTLPDLLPEFDFRPKEGHYVSHNTMRPDGREGHSKGKVWIYQSRPSILKCYTSSPSANIVKYIAEREGKSFFDVAKELSDRVGVMLPHWNEQKQQSYEAYLQRQSITDQAQSYFAYLLTTEEGAKVKAYLQGERGFTAEDIESTGAGFYPGRERLEAHLLKQKSADQKAVNTYVESFPSLDRFSLTLPIQRNHETQSFIFRDIAATEGGKYRYLKGYQKGGFLIGYTPNSRERLVIVEGVLDAAFMQSRGFKNVCAIGGSSLSDQQREDLLRTKAQTIILCFDGDTAGRKATEETLRFILKHTEGKDVLSVKLPEGSDPADVLKNGEDLRSYIDQAQPGYTALLDQTIKAAIKDHEHPTTADTEEALRECVKVAANIADGLTKGKFIDEVKDIFQRANYPVTNETIHEAEAKLRYDQRQAEELKSLQREIQSANRKLTEDPEGAKRILREALSSSVSLDIEGRVKTYNFESFLHEVRETPEELVTGITDLDRVFTIPPSAVTVIAGRPGHGKTTLMLNIFVNQVIRYPDRKFCFFSYEEPRSNILIKILLRLINHDFDYKDEHGEAFAGSSLYQYLQLGRNDIPEVEQAKETLSVWLQEERLQVYEEAFKADQLSEAVRVIKKRGNLSTVFIDYVQKIPGDSRKANRQMEIQEVSSIILHQIAVAQNLPVVIGAQLNRDAEKGEMKLSHLREAGDLEQDANTVVFLKKGIDSTEAGLLIRAMKRRSGQAGKEEVVLLHGAEKLITSMKGDAIKADRI